MDKNENFTLMSKNKRKILKDMLPLNKPLALFIEPSNYCNFRCTPCVHGQESSREDLKPFMHLDMDLYKKIIEDLTKWGGEEKVNLIRLTALGEPFVNPDLCEMIKIAKDANICEKLDLFSNGTLLTEKICSELVDNGLDAIRFSIYSVLPDKHKEVTKNDFDIYKIHENIKMLRRIRDEKKSKTPYIFVKMFESFGEENEVFFDMYKDIADEVGLEKIHDATKYNGSDLIGSFYKNEEDVQKTKDAFQNSLNNHETCSRPFMAMVVCSNGDVVMCTHDAPRLTKIDSAKDKTLKEIWNGKNLYEFRKMLLLKEKHKNPMCKNCDWFKLFPPEDNVDGIPHEKFMPKENNID